DMNTKADDTAGSIRTFVTGQLSPTPIQPEHTNVLRDAWNSGIIDFYANNLTGAQTSFRRAESPNPLFQAPSAFLRLPAFGTAGSGKNSTPTPVHRATPAVQGTSLFGYTIPDSQLVWLVIGGVVLLVILLLLLSLAFVRRQARRRRELAHFEEQ